jgi:hypothetical protein
MGSSGSGSFSDYSKQKSKTTGGKSGGASGDDQCGKAISTSLEEVSRCTYFASTGKVPSKGTEITIVFNGVRLAAVTKKKEEIGYLPTKYNYIKNCLADGYSYSGEVTSSSLKPVPGVLVDIVPA